MGASQGDVPECNSLSLVPMMDQPALWTEEMVRALIDCYERSEPKKRWLSEAFRAGMAEQIPTFVSDRRTLAFQANRNLVGDGVVQVTGSLDLDLVNDAPQGASRRIQGVIRKLQRDNILMELYRES